MGKQHRQRISSEVARLLKEARLTKGLSLSQLAEKTGLSYQMISYVEREMRSPTLETLLRIAESLETPLSRILSKAEEK